MRPNHWTNDMRPQSLIIENRTISPTERPLLIAEVSANHDRDLDQALALVDIAADAGWDCLKLQTYTADTLTLPYMTFMKVLECRWNFINRCFSVRVNAA